MNKVKKAIIPAAGLGTRFLPATKNVPKEMLPIVDTPIIFYVIEEAMKSGIEDIVLIAGRGKYAIEDFFDISYELEEKLIKAGKEQFLEKVIQMRENINVISIRQKQALGLGHAVLCGRPVIGDAPFAVLLGDEIMLDIEPHPPVTKQLCETFESNGISTVAVMEVEKSQVHKYGIIDIHSEKNGIYKVKNVIEKPSIEKAPSQLALPGRYVFSKTLFTFLENAKPGFGGEIQLTDAMTQLAHSEGLLAQNFVASRYDAGDKFGFIQANIEFALKNPDLSDKLKPYLKKLTQHW